MLCRTDVVLTENDDVIVCYVTQTNKVCAQICKICKNTLQAAERQDVRAAGNSLNQRLCDRDDLKQKIQGTLQNTEQQSVEPYCR